jgi:hypothetical protein
MLTEERSNGIKKPASTAISSAIFWGSRNAMQNPYGQVEICSAIKVTKINGGIRPVVLSYQRA